MGYIPIMKIFSESETCDTPAGAAHERREAESPESLTCDVKLGAAACRRCKIGSAGSAQDKEPESRKINEE